MIILTQSDYVKRKRVISINKSVRYESIVNLIWRKRNRQFTFMM